MIGIDHRHPTRTGPVIAGYRTQVGALFPGGEILVRPETYDAPG